MTTSITSHEFWIHSGIFVRLVILVLIVAVFQLWYIMRRLESKFLKLRQLTDSWPDTATDGRRRETAPKRVISISGKKTYAVAGLLFGVALMQILGWFSRETLEILGNLLLPLGLASLRSGIAKIGVHKC